MTYNIVSFFSKLFGSKSKQTVSDNDREKARDDRKAFSDANFNLGQQLLNAKQYEWAFEMFKLIAENDDHQDAQFNLAVMYHRGMGTEKNIHEAIRWYEAAANHKDNQAMYNLGLIYHHGDTDLPKDNEKSFIWMRKSFVSGNAKAQAFLHEIAVASFEYIANDLNLAPQKVNRHPIYAIRVPTTDGPVENCLRGAVRLDNDVIFLVTMPFRFTQEIKNRMESLLPKLNENTHFAKLAFNDDNQLQSTATVNVDSMIRDAENMEAFYNLLLTFTNIAASETRQFYDILNR